MVRISAIVITKDEEKRIAGCLESLRWADEILVVDSYSQDRTVEISRRFTKEVYQHPFTTYARQRNVALNLAKEDWVFFLDADERTTPPLIAELREKAGGASSEDPDVVGYWVPRRNIILGHWMRYAGWWPDYQMRFFRRDMGRYDEDKDPHEIVSLKGRDGHLASPILHYNYQTFGQLLSKQGAYSTREAQTILRSGLKMRWRWLMTQPVREFYRRYILWEGYKEGFLGLFLSLLMSWYRFQVYAKLPKLRKN